MLCPEQKISNFEKHLRQLTMHDKKETTQTNNDRFATSTINTSKILHSRQKVKHVESMSLEYFATTY